MSALIGVLLNTSSLFIAHIRAEYAFSMTRAASYNTVKALSAAFIGAWCSSLFFRVDKKRFFVCAELLNVLAFLLLLTGADTPLWYVSAAIMGPFASLSGVSIPYVLSRSFPEKPGTASGIAVAFGGVAGAVFSALAGGLVERMGWRDTLAVFCAVSIALCAAGIYLVFYKGGWKDEASGAPEHSSWHRRGFEREYDREGQSHFRNVRSFILVSVMLSGSTVIMQLIYNLGLFAQSIGLSAAQAASLNSMIMVGNIFGKLIFGRLCDRLSVWKAFALSSAAIGASLSGLAFHGAGMPLLMASAAVYGTAYALGTVGLSRSCAAAYGTAGQKRFTGYHVGIVNAVGAAASVGAGALYDRSGSFRGLLVMAAASVMLIMICSLILERGRKRA